MLNLPPGGPCIRGVTQILLQSVIDCDGFAPLTSNTHPHTCQSTGLRADTDYPISAVQLIAPPLFHCSVVFSSAFLPDTRSFSSSIISTLPVSPDLLLSSDPRWLPVVPSALGQPQPRSPVHLFLTHGQDRAGLPVQSLLLPQ